jgi:hypothetical protein
VVFKVLRRPLLGDHLVAFWQYHFTRMLLRWY